MKARFIFRPKFGESKKERAPFAEFGLNPKPPLMRFNQHF